MKYVFLGTFSGLILLSIVAWLIQPERDSHGKIPLIWISDPNPARREQVALFNQMHPKYELKLDPANSGMEKVIVQSLAGVGPDLFNTYGGSQLSAYVKTGIAWDVTDELMKLGIDPVRECWPAIHPDFVLDGRVYGFPSNAAANALWINKSIFDENGIPCPKNGPWTWDEFIPLAQKLTVRDKNGKAKQFGLLMDWWNAPTFIRQFGGSIFSKNSTRCVVDSPESIAGIQLMHDLVYKYGVMPSAAEEAAMATQGGWGSGTITLFSGGKAAMAIGGRWWLCTLRDNKNLRLGAVEAPHGPVRVFYGYGKGTLINKHSPRRKEALDFLIYEAGKEYNDLVNHQADALAPTIRYCDGPDYLHDAAFPNEDFNDVWRDIMKYAVAEEISPFVDGQVASRIINKELDFVKSNYKTPAEAMQAAAHEINEEIVKSLKRDPDLKKQYDETVARSAKTPQPGSAP